jgi:hypothetical protein
VEAFDMNRCVVVLAAMMMRGAPALAGGEAWGTASDADKCAKEKTKGDPAFVNGGWITFKNGAVSSPENVSEECRAEVNKRADACLADPEMQKKIKEAPASKKKSKLASILKDGGEKGPHMVCEDEAWQRLLVQRAKVAADAEAEAARKAGAEKAEMPTAGKKDATIEKMVSATYAKAFPAAKILKVVIVSDDWSTERNDLGAVIGRNIQVAVVNKQKDVCEVYSEAWYQESLGGQFKGPLSERGAGSLQRYEINCSKVK